MNTLLKNATAVVLDPPSASLCDIRISDGSITECARTLKRKSGEETVDLRGKMVMPGLICAHTHLYSSLSRGMPAPLHPPENFKGILREIWWKLDRALDDEAIYYSALAGAIEAVRCGTTTIVDHHASPNAITGSLDLIRDALQEVGIRGVLCYEVTDRGGEKGRDLGLQENDRFIRSHERHPAFRGLVGAHASFTLSDRTLHECSDLAFETGTGVHIHVAEDKADVLDARRKHMSGLIERLSKAKALMPRSVLAHCVHLQQEEIARIRDSGAWVVHNPRSNMNNNVGHAPTHLFGSRSALGTDGFPADMFEEARSGYFRNQESQEKADSTSMVRFLHAGQDLLTVIFGRKFGTLKKGSAADLLVLDYIPPTPLTSHNLSYHFLFGLRSSMVESVMIAGRWTVWNRNLVGIDEERVLGKATKVAASLWRRMAKL